MNREKAESHFQIYREALRRELMRLAAYGRVYQRLFERKVDRLAEQELASAFFVTTADALFFGIINAVDKLFDKKGERGIFNFLKFAEYHRELFDPKELKRRGNYPDEYFILRGLEPIIFKASKPTGRELLHSNLSLTSTFGATDIRPISTRSIFSTSPNFRKMHRWMRQPWSRLLSWMKKF